VIGCALAARAARELQSGAGIESYTIDGLLRDLADPQYGGLGVSTVFVVDESGMVGTRKLDALLRQAEEAHAKVVLVGDDRQLPEIDAGGAFRGLRERLPATELVENRRQRHEWERNALDLIREGKSEEAIVAYQAHDRVIVGESADAVRGRMVADWWAAKELGESGVMIAARKADVADLNDRARGLMLQEGAVHGEALSVSGAEFAEGDRIMTLRNSRALGVTNGTQGQVEAIDPESMEVRMRTDEGEEVTLPSSYLEAGHLTHAYAITGHKAQRMTTSHAFVLGDETVYREWGYVAMSRGTDENRLYVVGNGREMEVLGHGHKGPERGAVQDVASAMATSRAKSLAIEMEAPEYLQRTLGDRPLAPAERQRWSRAVSSVQEYRDRYGVDDEERALGKRPKAGLQRADYDVSARTVEKGDRPRGGPGARRRAAPGGGTRSQSLTN